MNVQIIIQRLKNKWFPTAEDNAWKEWVDFKQREEKDLIELLSSPVKEGFKKRALFLLLVPSDDFNPIYWTKKVGNFHHDSNFLNTLEPDLLRYATSLIINFYTTLKPMHSDNPKNYSQGGGGITILYYVTDKYHDALSFYNSCILLLLTLLPEEKCERIFTLFSLLDISTYWNIDFCSGYNPFQNLLNSNVDEKWKIRADTKMRQIIEDELAGNKKPREKWEDALDCYASIIQINIYGKELPYSVDLFASQMEFLVSEKHYNKEIINNWHVDKIMTILSADKYEAIRYQFAKFVVFGNKEKFSVWNEETFQGAKIMLNEFSQKDKELASKIQLAIKEYNAKIPDSKKRTLDTANTEKVILEKMKQ